MSDLDRPIAGSSAAAAMARRLSQRSTEETLRGVLGRVRAAPARVAEILADYPEPLVAFTAERKILAINPPAERLFGLGRHELDGRSTDELIPARLRQPDAPPMVALTDLTTVELPGLRRDGSEPSLAWTFGTVEGSPSPTFVMILRDRDEIDSAMEALQESEERFRLLVEGVRDHAILMLDPTGRIATWNSGAERIKGWRAADVVGQDYEIFFTPEDRAAGMPQMALAKAAAEGRFETTGWRMRRDGTRFYAEASLSALWNRDGELRGFAKVTHDLTQRWQAEENDRRLAAERAARQAAEATGERLRRLHRATVALSKAATPEAVTEATLDAVLREVGAAGGCIYMLDADGRTLRLLGDRGHSEDLVRANTTVPLEIVGPLPDAARTQTPGFYASREQAAADYPQFASELRAGGFEALVALPLVARGTTIGVFVVRYAEARGFDEADRSLLLTMSELCAQALERARLFAAESLARADAEAASRAKDEFLAMLGHELRNPLAPIATAIQLMKLRGDGRSARERDVIERQLRHLSTLVDDLLDVSRIARGKLELTREPVEMVDVLSKAVEMASPLFEQRGHHLRIDAPAAGLVVHGDPLRLAQVVSNLLTNAAKYTPPQGHVELRAETEDDAVVIRVRDDGAGIPAELVPRIFDLFVQGKRTFDRSEGGLGLGLALVRNLVSAHGGTVSASSDGPGKGSEFVVRLPALATGNARTTPPEERSASCPVKRRKRVLVVDDNEDAAEMLSEALSALGYDTELAFDGHAALERLRDFPAEAAVLDLGLPVIDGFELARRITDQFGERRPRLIALTGYGQSLDRARSQDAGFDAHLVKPVELDAVVAALEDLEDDEAARASTGS